MLGHIFAPWQNPFVGFNQTNLTFRFVLELVGLVGIFRLGLELGTGPWRWGLGLGLTLAAMVVWAVYRVPGDESASGGASYPVAGPVRLIIEVLVFAAGAVGWFMAGPPWMAWTYLGGLVLHHILSYDRLGWLLRVDSEGEPAFQSS